MQIDRTESFKCGPRIATSTAINPVDRVMLVDDAAVYIWCTVIRVELRVARFAICQFEVRVIVEIEFVESILAQQFNIVVGSWSLGIGGRHRSVSVQRRWLSLWCEERIYGIAERLRSTGRWWMRQKMHRMRWQCWWRYVLGILIQRIKVIQFEWCAAIQLDEIGWVWFFLYCEWWKVDVNDFLFWR